MPSVNDCVETVFIRARSRVQPSALGKMRMVSLVIQNTFNNMDGTANTSEIMVGNATGQPWQLVPGQQTPEIWADDLEDVWTRVRDTNVGTPVDVTVIIHKPKERKG